MAERITIMGNEPYVEWIERDGNAQRPYKRAGRPEPNARYARIRKDIAATRAND